jgi:adenylyltransferase/sulfurtransferase
VIAQITPLEVRAKLLAGDPVYFLDVRNPDEYAYARIGDSPLIPLPELPHRLDEVHPPKGALVVVYCHHGVRSLSGAAILQQVGFENVASLRGGIDAWSLTVDPSVPRY